MFLVSWDFVKQQNKQTNNLHQKTKKQETKNNNKTKNKL